MKRLINIFTRLFSFERSFHLCFEDIAIGAAGLGFDSWAGLGFDSWAGLGFDSWAGLGFDSWAGQIRHSRRRLATAAMFLRSCVAQALNEMDPSFAARFGVIRRE